MSTISSTTKQFKMRPDGFKEIRKQLLLRMLPIIFIAVGGGIAISSIDSRGKDAEVNVLPFVIPLAAVSVGIGLYRGITRQKCLFQSFTLTLTSNLITREQLNTPTIAIYINEIREIIKSKNGSLTIKGRNATDKIIIPAQIDKFSELEAELTKLHPIAQTNADVFLQKYRGLLSLITVGLVARTINQIVLKCLLLLGNRPPKWSNISSTEMRMRW